MKPIIISLFSGLLLFLSTSIDAQTHLRVGSGYYIWGSGDLLVPSVELEVRRDIGRWFSGGLEVNFGHYSSLGGSQEQFDYTFTTFASNQLLTFNLMNTDWMDLALVAGTSVRYQHQLLITGNELRGVEELEDGTFRYERNILFGGHLRPEVHIHFSDIDKVNVAASSSLYRGGEIFSGMSLSYMRKF